MPRKQHEQLYRVIGLRLARRRQAADLVQDEVAEKLGCRQQYVTRIEQGARRLDVVELQEFATLYGASLDELMAPPTAEEIETLKTERFLGRKRPRKR